MTPWTGRCLAGIGVLHVAVGVALFHRTLAVLVREGLFATVNGQPEREAAFWFTFAGLAVVLVGALVDAIERSGADVPRFAGWALLGAAALGCFVMPASGFWLVLVPALGLLARRRRLTRPAGTPPACGPSTP